jgi:hypothetical protein
MLYNGNGTKCGEYCYNTLSSYLRTGKCLKYKQRRSIKKNKIFKCCFSFFKNYSEMQIIISTWTSKTVNSNKYGYNGFWNHTSHRKDFLPEMRKCARMLKQKRFAAHRKAAKRTGEDDFLSVCHLSLRFHQVLEQDHGYLSTGS